MWKVLNILDNNTLHAWNKFLPLVSSSSHCWLHIRNVVTAFLYFSTTYNISCVYNFQFFILYQLLNILYYYLLHPSRIENNMSQQNQQPSQSTWKVRRRGAGPKATALNYVPRSRPQFSTDSSRWKNVMIILMNFSRLRCCKSEKKEWMSCMWPNEEGFGERSSPVGYDGLHDWPQCRVTDRSVAWHVTCDPVGTGSEEGCGEP